MSIAFTGATGQLGRLVLANLLDCAGAEKIVALVRSPENARDLGVETRRADYDEPSTLTPALKGINTLLLISSNEIGKRAGQHRAVIDAAKVSGVSHIVYTSVLKADTSPLSLAEEHQRSEAMIKASELTYTILRNGWYTENYTSLIPAAVATGTLIGSAGNGRIASATRADFAAAAAAVLTGAGHENKTYELAGDEAYTLTDLAAEISAQTGKAISYRDLPQEEYTTILVSSGLPRELATAVAGFDIDASNGALYYDGHELSQLIARSTTPLSDAVAAALT